MCVADVALECADVALECADVVSSAPDVVYRGGTGVCIRAERPAAGLCTQCALIDVDVALECAAIPCEISQQWVSEVRERPAVGQHTSGCYSRCYTGGSV